ncbi:DEAD/DEAH box helicase family protein [Magnetospira sp. QH-2]|uniref:DEAD/DEAH box helicase family protein n=1 Tax=Magnetospira sp. (strain QH-2) TaxID=1288970 RepID=UPI0003E8131C|nr:DEAD/DEAH box helicase family protein [Magnetospira sp. QH-2]CCQ73917.1 Conserved protein of unknown function [Magnetospira sp. QH-2]
MTVEPNIFVESMTKRWSTLGNTPSPRLQAVWRIMAETFNTQIENHDSDQATRWRVLNPETGAGKTQGLSVYCSLLAEEDHPGVLIITRMKVQADEIADTINLLAGDEGTALAYHSDNRVPVINLLHHPVLVITHKAYEIGMDAVNRGQPEASNWDNYHAFKEGQRRLVIIDEALDILEEARVNLDKVNHVLGLIPSKIQEEHPLQIEAVNWIKDIFEEMQKRGKGRTENHSRALYNGHLDYPESRDMSCLRRALVGVRFDLSVSGREDAAENRRIRMKIDGYLKDIQAIMSHWNWYTKLSTEGHTINTARMIIPEDIKGAVVLDATASANVVYDLFDRATFTETPRCRKYGNVTLHVSKGHSVGKVSLTRKAKDVAEKLFSNITEKLGEDRKVFMVCHQALEPHLIQYQDAHFSSYDVGHWWALDGRNDWQDYDAAVIFGLPYRDPTWSANAFMALQGQRSTSWLNSDGDRPFKTYRDIRQALNTGHIVVSVIQAINRIRTRRVIDEDGNCSTADVFLLLPGGETGETILEGIAREMPGIEVVDWKFKDATRKPRRSNHAEALVRYMVSMRPGKKAVTRVREELGIPSSTWERLTVRLKDPEDELAIRLEEVGCRYILGNVGRRVHAFLTKDERPRVTPI